MAQAEGQRVLAALGRQLVHEGLDGEDVGEGAQRAQRRGADRHGQQPVAGDVQGRQVVERHGVALRAAAVRHRRIEGDEALERLGELRGGEHGRDRRPPGPRHVAVAPDLAAPADDLAAERRDRPRSRWPWPRPSATRRARPRATIARARGARRPRAPAARRRRPRRRRRCGRSSPHLRRAARRCSPAAAQRERQVGAQVVDALAVRPDLQLVGARPLRDRAGRAPSTRGR